MMDAIREGYCMLGKRSSVDYWGNTIPSRFQVENGTKGSPEFVKTAMGEDWYKMMQEI